MSDEQRCGLCGGEIGPDIIEHPSPNHSPRKAGVRVDTIVIHHTATPAVVPALTWLCDRQSGVSAHYVIGRYPGEVYRLVPEHLKAWHAGKGRLPWETCEPYDFNHRSIGIEVVNPGDGKTPFTEAQYTALGWLVPDIARRMDSRPPFVLPRGDEAVPGWMGLAMKMMRDGRTVVLGHRDVAPGRKFDPADNFRWDIVRDAVRHGFAGGVT